MYSAIICLLLLVSFSQFALAQFTKTDFSDKIADVQEIRKSMLEIERAFVSREVEPFERIFIDGYIGVKTRPVFNTREQLVAMVNWDAVAMKSGKKLDFETLSYESDHPSIRIVGQTAVVNVLKKNLWRYRDKKCLSRYQATEVWLKRESKWKLASGHMTTFQCDPMPWQPPHPAIASIRSQTRPSKNIVPNIEIEVLEFIRQNFGTDAKIAGNADVFSSEYVSTGLNGFVGRDKELLLGALRVGANRDAVHFRDDEIVQVFDDTAIYLFRLRSSVKEGETKPAPPIIFSVVLVKQNGAWQLIASHASTFSD